MKTEKSNPAAVALQADRDGVSQAAAQATTSAHCRIPRILASAVAGITLAITASAQSGINFETTSPPGYAKPLTLYTRDGHIYGAWAVGNKGNRDGGAFQVGFYIGGKRTLVATFSNGLRAGYMGYGTDAPFDSLPEGDSVVELKVNDSRWVSEDTLADNNYAITVRVNRGGSGGTPPAISRSEAGYKWPSTLGYSSPSRIISRMGDMFNAQWVPVVDFTNWRVSGSTGSYLKSSRYYGLPYTQVNPQTDVTGFTQYLPAMSGVLTSTTSAGVDCSGSISIAMELPSRQTTWSFDQPSTYFTTVVQPGTLVRNAAKIQPGDAINSSSWGHVVLVVSAPVNGKVDVLEATADQGRNLNGTAQRWAVVKNTRSLSDLDANNCRVIRRSKLN